MSNEVVKTKVPQLVALLPDLPNSAAIKAKLQGELPGKDLEVRP